MESKRAFLGRFLGKGDSQAMPVPDSRQDDLSGVLESAENLPDSDKKQPGRGTRRDFLKGAAVVGTVAIVETALPGSVLAQAQEDDQETGASFQECADKLPNAIYYFIESRGGLHGKPLTLKEQEDMRRDFLISFPDIDSRLDFVCQHSGLFDKSGDLNVLISESLSYLAIIGSHGLVYSFLDKKISAETEDGRIKKFKLFDRFRDGSEYYGALATDFLPSGNAVTPGEIDPRFNVVDSSDSPFAPFSMETREATLDNINVRKGWTEKDKVNFFRRVLADESVRRIFVSRQLTLAECYSLIKAVYNFRQDNPDAQLSDDLIVEKLLQEQEIFAGRTILGPSTDRFIHFNFFEEDDPKHFSGDTLDAIAKAAGVKRDNITRIDGGPRKSSSDPKDRLAHAITQSRGETTVYFNTHGRPSDLLITRAGNGYTRTINIQDLAFLLNSRLADTKDPEDLGKITIIVDSCHSYMFTRNLINRLRFNFMDDNITEVKDGVVTEKSLSEVLGISFEKLALPTVISSAQVGSWGFSTENSIETVLQKESDSIAREGKLTGRFMLKRVQPQAYVYADMTFFSGGHGAVTEIGENEDPANKNNDIKSV